MSEVLLAFVEPHQEHVTTRDAFERLIAIAVLARNAAIVSREGRQSLLDKTNELMQKSAGNKENAEGLRALVNDLIERKGRYFANNKRLVVTCQITEEKGRYHLAVASMPFSMPSGR